LLLFSRTTDTRRVASGRNSVCKHAGETYNLILPSN